MLVTLIQLHCLKTNFIYYFVFLRGHNILTKPFETNEISKTNVNLVNQIYLDQSIGKKFN